MTGERPNIVTIAMGLVFMALGILLLFQTHGMITIRQVVQWWPAALVLIGSATVWQAMRGGDAAKSIPVGGLFWLVFLAVLFTYTFDRMDTGKDEPPGTLNVFSVFSEHHPAVTGEFHGAKLTAVMGGATLDLRNASVAPDETVVLDVFAMWGGGDIRVPRNWDVSIDTTSVMGAVRDQRDQGASKTKKGADASFDAAALPAPSDAAVQPAHLVVRGTAIMGGFTIKP
jgi:predicted membrane protein